jgi:hypothetical protein
MIMSFNRMLPQVFLHILGQLLGFKVEDKELQSD